MRQLAIVRPRRLVRVFCLLLWGFRDSIEVYVSTPGLLGSSTWGGVEVLFMMNAVGLGWGTVAYTERRTGASGIPVALAALAWSSAALGAGFFVVAIFSPISNAALAEMLMLSVILWLGATAVRTYLADVA